MPLVQIEQEWEQQPDEAVSVAYDDPITGRVRFALIGGAYPIEICRNLVPSGSIGTAQCTPGGVAYVLPNGYTSWRAKVAALDPYTSGSFFIHWHGVLRANTLQELLNHVGGYGWQFKTLNWGTNQIRFQLHPFWRGSGGVFATSPLTCIDNTLHSVTAVYDDAAATISIYFDGVFAGSGGFNKDPGAISDAADFSMFGHATTPHRMLTVQAYAGLPPADAILALTANPWRTFGRADEEIIWIPSTDTGVGVDLVASALIATSAGSTSAITQAHILVSTMPAQGNLLVDGAISQTHVLAGSALSQASASSVVAVGQEHSFTGAAGAQGNAASVAAIAQTHVLAGGAGAQGSTISTAGVTQTHALAVTANAQANTGAVSSVLLGAVVMLTGAPSTQNNASQAAAIGQGYALVFAPSVQDVVAATSSIVQAHMLSGGAAIQTSASPGVAIVIPGVAVPVDAPAGVGARLRDRRDVRPGSGRDIRPRQ